MLEDWKTSVVVPIYKEKGDVTNCKAYRKAKLLEDGMKMIKKVLEKRIRALAEVNDMQFGFMPGRGMTDALVIVRMQDKYREKDKLYMCFRPKKSNAMGTEEDRTTKDLGESSDEFV